jgi:hypothetical protein
VSLFPSITPDVAKRYLDAGKAQKNDVSELLKAMYAPSKHPSVMFNSVTGERIDSKEAWARMVATKRPRNGINAKKWDMAVNGESFSARLREEDISDWIGPDEEEDEDE